MPAELKTCRICRKLFQYVVGDIVCPNCRKESEEQFKIVKDYIWSHKGCTIPEVCEACDVDAKQVKNWLKQGRLELDTPSIDLTCEKCNKPIISGRLCPSCTAEVRNAFSQFKKTVVAVTSPSQTTKSKDRFHIRDFNS